MNKINSWLLNSTSTSGLLVAFLLPIFAEYSTYISQEQAITTIYIEQDIYCLCKPCGETIPQIVDKFV